MFQCSLFWANFELCKESMLNIIYFCITKKAAQVFCFAHSLNIIGKNIHVRELRQVVSISHLFLLSVCDIPCQLSQILRFGEQITRDNAAEIKLSGRILYNMLNDIYLQFPQHFVSFDCCIFHLSGKNLSWSYAQIYI